MNCYVMNTETFVNPRTDSLEKDSSYEVIRIPGDTFVAKTWGEMNNLGDEVFMYDAQTHRPFGKGTVIGIRKGDGTILGRVEDDEFELFVYK
jgi:hypothetical protein